MLFRSVHPSLYPLRIGHTHILNQGETGPVGTRVITLDEYMDPPDFGRGYDPHWALSDSFQWLPTDFQVSKTGKVKALGYINNLHPVHHKETYGTVARLLERFLPLFENVVADTLGPERPHAIQVDPLHWYDGLPTEEEDDAAHEHEDADASTMDADWQWYSYEQRICWPIIPDPKPFAPPANADARRPAFSLAGRTLQVIVKLANVVLTPDNPRYPGGAWHVEGMLNERIVATGIYYYACANITESRLAFRMTVGADDPYEMMGTYKQYAQDDVQGTAAAWGIARDRPLNQEIGHVVAEEGKCVAFPNVYQHCVMPFELDDWGQPGYRKVLCFFLVDPTNRVLSTSTVVPQQEAWLEDVEVVRAAMPALRAKGVSKRRREEVVQSAREAGMGREEAEAVREQFMRERSQFVVHQAQEVYELEFNMCEH